MLLRCRAAAGIDTPERCFAERHERRGCGTRNRWVVHVVQANCKGRATRRYTATGYVTRCYAVLRLLIVAAAVY